MIVIAFVNPAEPKAFDHYASSMRELYTSVGAEIVDRYPVSHLSIGEDKPDFILIVSFPSEEALRKLFESKEYQELIAFREKAFKKLTVYLSKEQ
ncbi:DUF1330 domain-containing protein [Roseivirga sp.]|uniref:DUF1330 domain-containing protein n=1 Tax=Roseivirga sp. TaxID=1964215 RepID=UPI003B51FEFF